MFAGHPGRGSVEQEPWEVWGGRRAQEASNPARGVWKSRWGTEGEKSRELAACTGEREGEGFNNDDSATGTALGRSFRPPAGRQSKRPGLQERLLQRGKRIAGLGGGWRAGCKRSSRF